MCTQRQLGKPKRRGEDKVKMELDGTVCEGVVILISP
jgi:hypothetical protein